ASRSSPKAAKPRGHHRRKAHHRATKAAPVRRNRAIFPLSVAKMRHLARAAVPYRAKSEPLEREARPGLEAVQEICPGLEQRPPADRAAGLFVKGRLRRLGRRVD